MLNKLWVIKTSLFAIIWTSHFQQWFYKSIKIVQCNLANSDPSPCIAKFYLKTHKSVFEVSIFSPENWQVPQQIKRILSSQTWIWVSINSTLTGKLAPDFKAVFQRKASKPLKIPAFWKPSFFQRFLVEHKAPNYLSNFSW